jgi:hypothetical protein
MATAVQVEMIFDDVISMESLGTSSIVFAYCDGDHFKHSFGSSGHIYIRKHHSAVINQLNQYQFLAFQKYNCSVLTN